MSVRIARACIVASIVGGSALATSSFAGGASGGGAQVKTEALGS
jgi:hypothetical protein